MDQITWKEIEIFIRHVLESVCNRLDKESSDAIEHYLKHDEYEMAFEILFIEILKIDNIPKIDFKRSREVAELLKLNEETVFDMEFWKKFEKLVDAQG